MKPLRHFFSLTLGLSVSMNEPQLLLVQHLKKSFGGVLALDDYALSLARGDFVGLIGPNGAGKTTIFNLLSGVVRPFDGRIVFKGKDITGLRPDRRARLGISRTFQNIRLFGDMSVLDNIRSALHMSNGCGIFPTLLHFPRYVRSEREIDRIAFEKLETMGLTEVSRERAAELPYGLQRRVEIARALAAGPGLLLLDEPAAGMNAQEKDDLAGIIRQVHAGADLAILLVEHDMQFVMKLCGRIQVVDQGRILAEGSPERIRSDPKVIAAYLGIPGSGIASGPEPAREEAPAC
jgi:branched-chain amino acid transport system ATP-binding protein